MLKYEKAQDLNETVADIVSTLDMKHLDPERILCMRSTGSKSKRIVARIHALQRIVSEALDGKIVYVIEFICENFDKLSREEQLKTVIHEMLHIPRTFGGGLLGHKRYVRSTRVKKFYDDYVKSKDHPQIKLELAVQKKTRAKKSQAL
ncbi:MAG: putative metallopeptidase [Pseudomonadota bacterium]